MLGIAERHPLVGGAIFFDPKGDRAAPGEITNGFADLQLRDVDMRDENLDGGAAVLPLVKGPPTRPTLPPSHKKGPALFPPQQQWLLPRVERKAFGVLVNTPGGEDPVGKKDVLLFRKPSGGFPQETTQAVLGKSARRENRYSNPAVPASARPASTAAASAAPKVVHHHHGPAKTLPEDADDKENQPPPKALPGVDAKDDRGRDGETFELIETTIRRLREHAEKEREAAGPDDDDALVWPMPLEVAKSRAIPGVRFRQGVLGELSVVDLYSTGERISIPSKGLLSPAADGGGGGGGCGVPHMMTEHGRAEVKAYLSAVPAVFRDPNAGGDDDREDVAENQLVDMFLSLHFGDGWLEGDTVITRPPRAGPHPLVEDDGDDDQHPPPQDTGCSPAGRPAKRYCASSPDHEAEAGPVAADAAQTVEHAQRPPTMGPPAVPIRRDASVAACGSRPIPIRHKGARESSFLRFREPPPPVEARSFVSESEGDDDPCRSFESVSSTQPGTYGTSGHEQQLVALDALHIGRPSSSSSAGGDREPAAAAGAGLLLRGDFGKEN